MQVTYIYNLFFYKFNGASAKLNTQIFKLVLILQGRIKKCSMRLMARDETVFKNTIKHICAGNTCNRCAQQHETLRGKWHGK